MNRHQMRRAIPLILLAGLLAIVLKDVVWNEFISPILYQLWLAWIFLRSMPQIVFWNSLVVLIAFATFIILVRKRRQNIPISEDVIMVHHPIAELSKDIKDIHKGTFFKWLLANHLATLAQSILIYQHGEELESARSLMGRDWNPPADIQKYLKTGLARSFIVKPRRWYSFRSSKFALDIDLSKVVAYLEKQMEIKVEH